MFNLCKCAVIPIKLAVAHNVYSNNTPGSVRTSFAAAISINILSAFFLSSP